jgi:hypothetical protein
MADPVDVSAFAEFAMREVDGNSIDDAIAGAGGQSCLHILLGHRLLQLRDG